MQQTARSDLARALYAALDAGDRVLQRHGTSTRISPSVIETG